MITFALLSAGLCTFVLFVTLNVALWMKQRILSLPEFDIDNSETTRPTPAYSRTLYGLGAFVGVAVLVNAVLLSFMSREYAVSTIKLSVFALIVIALASVLSTGLIVLSKKLEEYLPLSHKFIVNFAIVLGFFYPALLTSTGCFLFMALMRLIV